MNILTKSGALVKNRSHRFAKQDHYWFKLLVREANLDQDLYLVLDPSADYRNFQTLGDLLGVSRDTSRRSCHRLARLGLIRLDPLPNGKRKNPRYRIVKLRNRLLKVEDLFRAPHFETWKTKNKPQLLFRYMLMGWNICPLMRREKKPIFSKQEWARKSQEQKLTEFKQGRGIGLWIDDLVVYDFDYTDAPPDYNTLMTKSPHGYHCYFTRTQETKHIYNMARIAPNIDTRARGGLIVLPPTRGYKWIKAMPPQPLPKDLLALWNRWQQQQEQESKTAKAISLSGKLSTKNLPKTIVYPQRGHALFVYGRSLRPRTFEFIDPALRTINQKHCQPPIAEKRLKQIIDDVLTKPDAGKWERSK
jgi:hypothetical protein